MAIVSPRNTSSLLGHLASYRNLSEIGRQRAVEQVSQMPLRLQQIVLGRIARMRAERFEESQASKAKKEKWTTMGVGAGGGALAGGLTGGLFLGPVGALVGAGIGAGTGAMAGAVGSTRAASTVGQTFGAAQDYALNQPMFDSEYANLISSFLDSPTAAVGPTGAPAEVIGQLSPLSPGTTTLQQRTLGEPTVAEPATKVLGARSTLEEAVEEPAGAALVTPTAMRRATERIKAIGKQRMAEGNADEAIRLAKLVTELETGVAA